MRDGAAEQAAPTIHQSLIRNNSTADSLHEIVPLHKQAIFFTRLRLWSLRARSLVRIHACVSVYVLVRASCYCLLSFTSQGEDGLQCVSTMVVVETDKKKVQL